MERRRFVLMLLAGPFSAPFGAEAQHAVPPSVARIGVFFSASPPERQRPYGMWGRTLVTALRDLGWVEGQNLVVEWRYSEGHDERRREIAQDFVRRKLDVILVQSTPEALEMKRATTTIPIVLVLIGDPIGAGLVQSLAQPGGNITGTSLMTSETRSKDVEFLKILVPGMRRAAVLWNPENASTVRSWSETREAAGRLNIELLSAEVRKREDLPTAFATIVQQRPHALIVLSDSLVTDHRHQIVQFAATNRLPALYGNPPFAEAGGLLVRTVDFHEVWRRAAIYVDRILKGAKPHDLPLEQPTKFELIVNLKTAKALGLTVPPSLLLQANRIIE